MAGKSTSPSLHDSMPQVLSDGLNFTELNAPDQLMACVFPAVVLLVGVGFTFYGKRVTKLFFFGVGGVVGFSLISLILNEILPASADLPISTKYLLCGLGGVLGGFLTLSMIPLAMFCLGASAGILSSGFLYQFLSGLIPYLVKILEGNGAKDSALVYYLLHPPNVVRIAFFIAVPVLCGYLASTKNFTDFVFALVSSTIGGYLILLGVNNFQLIFSGQLFTALWELDALLGQSADQIIHIEDARFWIFVNIYIVLIGLGCFMQLKYSGNDTYRML